jgi:predicted transcriptional regulator
MTQTALLVSIRPRFAELIFSGSKQIELRRRCPRINAGDAVFVYVSSPVMALIGAFEVGKIVEGTPAKIWRTWGTQTGLDRAEYDRYFEGISVAYGLVIVRSWRLPTPVKLASLRRRHAGFHPPQAYHYVPLTRLSRLGGMPRGVIERNSFIVSGQTGRVGH